LEQVERIPGDGPLDVLRGSELALEPEGQPEEAPGVGPELGRAVEAEPRPGEGEFLGPGRA